jgi:hypothetical protein
VLRQVLLEEDPGTADLCAGDLSGFGACAEFLRMAAQEGSGFV